MFRLAVAFGLLSLLLCSVGCRMCCTPHDYRLAAYIDRCEDYRGFSPTYRAGSVLGGDRYSTCSLVIGNACYAGSTGDIYDNDLYNNAGNYGTTLPVSPVPRGSATFESHPQPPFEPSPIGVPPQDPAGFLPHPPPQLDQNLIGVPPQEPANRIPPAPRRRDGNVPSVEQLLQQPRGTMPDALPITPPTKPRVVPPASNDTLIETVPFSPSDETSVPPSASPMTKHTSEPTPPGLQITLEELRRLDPSVHDLQIISIEDASVATPVR